MAEGNPFSVSKIEALTGSNYQVWALKVSAILRSRKLFRSVIEENEPNVGAAGSNEAKVREAWETKNDEAFGIIVITLSPEQAGLFIGETKAKTVWEELKRIHAGSVEDRKIDISLELKNVKQGNNECVDDYITRARNIASRSAALGQIISEREIVYHAVRGLHSRMDNIALVLRPQRALTLEEVQQALREEEIRHTHCRKQNSVDQLSNEKAYKVRDIYKGHRDVNKKCFICGKPNHIAKDCWHRNDKRRPDLKHESNRNRGGTQNSRKEYRKKEQANLASGNREEHAFSLFTPTSTGRAKGNETRLWSLDSGCTSHMTPMKDWMENLQPYRAQINLAEEGRYIQAEGKGNIRIQTLTNDGIKDICVYDVLYVPKLRTNLLSVKSLISKGNQVTFNIDKAQIFNRANELIAEAMEKERMFVLESRLQGDQKEITANCLVAASKLTRTNDSGPITENDRLRIEEFKRTSQYDKQLWHKRLGHLNEKYMDRMQNNEMVKGLKIDRGKLGVCEPCIMGKLVQTPFKPVDTESSNCTLELIHMDLCGPFSNASLGGAKYMYVLVDSYSRRIFVIFLKSKEETFERFVEFKNQVENERNVKIKNVRSDNGSEFENRNFDELFKKAGIRHQRTVRYSPQSNGVAERANRSLLDMARTMLIEAELPVRFWAEAVATAAYLKNRTPSKKNGLQTAMEKWNGHVPNVSYLKAFGSIAYHYIPKNLRNKLESKAKKGIFVGYSQKRRAYRIFDPEEKKIIESRTVQFNEDLKGGSLLTRELNSTKSDVENLTYEMETEELFTPKEVSEQPVNQEVGPEGVEIENAGLEQEQHHQEPRQPGRKPGISNEMIRALHQMEVAAQEERLVAQGVRRSERLKNHDHANVSVESRGKITIPITYRDAIMSPQAESWENAMQDEIQSLNMHKVWKLVPRTAEMKVMKSKWVFNNKTNLNGTVDKLKARLVAVGYNQRLGIDYEESFSPVMKLESLRTLVALASQLSLKVKQYDIKTAYLHGELKEVIYMEQPEGFILEGNEGKVCQLHKSLYGLPQSGRCWNEKLNSVLTDIGLTRLTSDPCIYKLEQNGKLFLLGVYVDDIFVAGTDDIFINSIIDKIKEHFIMTEVQEGSTFLGISIQEKANGFELSQEQYVNKILERFNLSECNPMKTPGDPHQNLDQFEESLPVSKETYQEMLGSLMYLSVGTRADITYNVSCLSQYLKDPRQIHLQAVKRVFRYLQGTKSVKLFYDREKGQLQASTDASWNSTKDAKSFTGYTIKLGDALVHWKTRKQTTVALSTCEAELISICEGLRDLQWHINLVAELAGGAYSEPPFVMHTDSQSALDWIRGTGTNPRTKHINRKYYYIRDEVSKGNIILMHVRSEEMEADILTKSLSREKLGSCNQKLGLTI